MYKAWLVHILNFREDPAGWPGNCLPHPAGYETRAVDQLLTMRGKNGR